MKFKPTPIKSIVSVLVGIGAFFLLLHLFPGGGDYFPDLSNPGISLCVDYAPASNLALFVSIISLILIYLIWSLLDTKKK